MQMLVRQLEHDADARFSQRQRERFSGFSQEADHALEDQRESLATEVTSEVWRRPAQQVTTHREMFEHSRAAQATAGPEN